MNDYSFFSAPQLKRNPLGVTLASAVSPSDICAMTPKSILQQALRLPVKQRLELVEEIWDSIAADSSQVPVPDWHKAELDRRLAEPNAERLTWDEVQKRLGEPE